jgi:site-specific DNA recombinase
MGDLEYAGKHEALVSPEVWQKVNDRLAQNKKAYKRSYCGSDGLLSGLLFCGDCGARMSIRQWGWKSSKVNKYICYSVSRCSKRMIKSDSCSNRKEHFTVSDLDALVLEEIKKLALDPASLDVLVEESAGEAPPDLEAFRERLGNVEKQITRLLNLYQTGIVGLEEIQDRLSVLKEERKAAQNCLDEAEAEDSGKMSKGEAAAALASLSGIIEAGDSDGLFALVHSLIEKVVVLNGNVTIYWAFC